MKHHYILPLLFLLPLSTFAQSGGNLLAPASPADNLMKTTAEAEARTAISSVPYTISTPGSYYFTKNLSVVSGTAIQITSSDVSLDLMGHRLKGHLAAFTGTGISVGTAITHLQNIHIYNGGIEGFSNSVTLRNVNNSKLSRLRAISSVKDSIVLNGAGSGGQCNGNSIRHCSASNAGLDGISLSGSSNGQCNGNKIFDCTISHVNKQGISLRSGNGQALGNRIIRCSISHAKDRGASFTGTPGANNVLGNVLQKCTISNTEEEGISLDEGCNGNKISQNKVTRAKGSGIRVRESQENRIEGNYVQGVILTFGVSYGYRINLSPNNIIIKNTAMGQTNNFSVSPTSTTGPEVSATGVLPSTGAAVHPWANFSLN